MAGWHCRKLRIMTRGTPTGGSRSSTRETMFENNAAMREHHYPQLCYRWIF